MGNLTSYKYAWYIVAGGQGCNDSVGRRPCARQIHPRPVAQVGLGDGDPYLGTHLN